MEAGRREGEKRRVESEDGVCLLGAGGEEVEEGSLALLLVLGVCLAWWGIVFAGAV